MNKFLMDDALLLQIILISIIALAILIFIIVYFFIKGEFFISDIEKSLLKGDYQSVISKSLKYIKNKGGHYQVYYFLAQAYEKTNASQSAIECYEKALISLSENSNISMKNSIMLKLGDLYCSLKKWTNAIGYYRFVLDKTPSHPKALKNISQVYFELKKYSSVLETLQKYILLKSNDSNAHLMLSKTFHYLNNYQKSLDEMTLYYQYENTISPEENSQNMLITAGNYMGLGKYKEGAASLKPLLQDKKINPKTLSKYITCLIQMNDFVKVGESIEEFVFRLQPQDRCPVLYELANVYYSIGDYYRALDLWKSIQNINPGYMDIKEIMKRFELLIQNPNLRVVYQSNDWEVTELFMKKLKLFTMDKVLESNQNFIIFKENSFCSVLFKKPEAVNKVFINEIEDSLKINGYINISIDLYTLFGIDDTGKKHLYYQKIREISGNEFIQFMN